MSTPLTVFFTPLLDYDHSSPEGLLQSAPQLYMYISSADASSISSIDGFFAKTGQWLFVMSTQLIGFSIGGICQRVLVAPASMIWPYDLATCAIFNTLHSQDTTGSRGRDGISRLRFFTYVSIGYFFYSQFPNMFLTLPTRSHDLYYRLLSFLPLHGPLLLFVGMLDRS
jgi:OPT oligopeptide transporter protein